jgi:3-oxoacyl-[acyl-carrier-protein] synthase-3
MSRLSGISHQVFIDKIGMEQKHIASDDEQPSEMGIRATKEAIRKACIDSSEIDIIAYCGAGFYDYRIWSPAARIQDAIGANDCYAFEVKNAATEEPRG